jgi:hypothetical protein
MQSALATRTTGNRVCLCTGGTRDASLVSEGKERSCRGRRSYFTRRSQFRRRSPVKRHDRQALL